LRPAERQAVRQLGSVVGTSFSCPSAAILHARCAVSRRAGARYAGVVRPPVVLNARGAGVVRTPVVRMARCAVRDRVRRVILPNARCAGVIPGWCGSAERPLCRVVPCWGGARGWRQPGTMG